MISLNVLLCSDCKHDSACCFYGVSLTLDESEAIRKVHSDDVLYWNEHEGEYRTVVVDGHCTFLKNNKCLIHDKEYYPQTCRDFPFNYNGDVTICPELRAKE